MKNFLSRLAGTAFVVLGVALQNSGGCSADERQMTLVALGDGFLTGDGITPGKELPVLLEAALIARGHVVKMQNIFIETSVGGAKWMTRQKGKDFLTQPGGRAERRTCCHDRGEDTSNR